MENLNLKKIWKLIINIDKFFNKELVKIVYLLDELKKTNILNLFKTSCK